MSPGKLMLESLQETAVNSPVTSHVSKNNFLDFPEIVEVVSQPLKACKKTVLLTFLVLASLQYHRLEYILQYRLQYRLEYRLEYRLQYRLQYRLEYRLQYRLQ